MYVHRYGITFKEGIAMLEGPIAYLMFVKKKKQKPMSDPIHVSYGRSVFGGFIYTNAKVYGIPQIYDACYDRDPWYMMQ